MSTVDEDLAEPAGEPAGRLHLALRALALVLVLASFVALWTGERQRASHDLQLVMEPVARPGDVLAVRAILLADVEAPAGPTLKIAPIAVALFDAQKREIAKVALRPSIVDSMEGMLAVPANAQGALIVEARGELDGQKLTSRRSLLVRSDPALPEPVGRLAGPLQQLSIGRVRAQGEALPPRPFAPRVLGGSCSPEERCTVLIWVGEPAAAITPRASRAVDLLAPPEPGGETEGLVRLDLRVHGAEAELTLEARRAGELVAERSIRLPVALGEPALSLDRVLLDSHARPEVSVRPPPGRAKVIVDGYVAALWSYTVAFAPSDAPIVLEAFPKATGIVRLQARSDPFSADAAATRLYYARAPGESDARALARIASLRDGLEQADQEVTRAFLERLPRVVPGEAERWAAFLLAPFELSRMRVPLAVSGRSAQLTRIAHVRTFLRFGVGAMLVLGAVVVGASLMRRGLIASDEASAIMRASLDVRERTGRDALRDRLRVIALVVAVCMAFLAAALLIVAKPLWF